MSKTDTGLKDSFGTPIMDGDTIEWTYTVFGVSWIDENGNEKFFSCVGGFPLETRERTLRVKIEYTIKEDCAGYFLNMPKTIATPFVPKPTCKVIYE